MTDCPTHTFTLSIEPIKGPVFTYGFHLGTIEAIARRCAEEIFNSHNAHGRPVRTVALVRDRAIFDVFDGVWFSTLVEEAV